MKLLVDGGYELTRAGVVFAHLIDCPRHYPVYAHPECFQKLQGLSEDHDLGGGPMP